MNDCLPGKMVVNGEMEISYEHVFGVKSDMVTPPGPEQGGASESCDHFWKNLFKNNCNW